MFPCFTYQNINTKDYAEVKAARYTLNFYRLLMNQV